MKIDYISEHLTPFMLGNSNHCQSHGWKFRLRSGLVSCYHITHSRKAPCSMTTIVQNGTPATEDFPKLKPHILSSKLSQPNYTVNTWFTRREIPQSWIFVDYGKRQLNILIQVENLLKSPPCDLSIQCIEAKDRTGEVLSSESESSDLKNTQSTFNWRSIVEISSIY
jgi:hypothetical protein